VPRGTTSVTSTRASRRLCQTRFRSGRQFQRTLHRDLRRDNRLRGLDGPGEKPPVQAAKDWRNLNPGPQTAMPPPRM
jgi:hypothetical protein